MTDLAAAAGQGVAALSRGDAAAARTAFETVVAAGRATPQLWLLLAQANFQLDDRKQAHAALDELLAVDRANLDGMVMRGELLDRDGETRAATSWFEAALRTADGVAGLAPVTIAALDRAKAACAAASAKFDAHLRSELAAAGVDAATVHPRFAEAMAITTGVAAPYPQAPTSFYYPRLAAIPFHDPADFPWVAAIAAQAPAMRAEVEAVIAAQSGLAPYVEAPENRPSKEHSLLGDARWSAYHLWKNGEPVAEHHAACPRTIAAVESAPIPHIPGRGPMALFSILAGGTHIPAHNGMLNTRLIVHIPLIVPPGCRLRVGNEVRTVEAGVPLIFDDSIEHEAWNDSDEPRAILLFEVWRPELTAGERAALTAMFGAVSSYG
ncbi:aspartyl/asparaginyl beta-hydroxylase domain-containing protein [Polymorphobacter megasporae]|uniref:aspartyl/asparaginyl beta-hydroxylase domain-containing protein n=1 Tax=Glacieibacterium megasporae TaxID=2835787 RepID=UPI001C1E2AA1|nr:aspartyl/asparaginyl beta-hydroxylase domain-containing protein [Polymorphobacter megasporae]UAJ10188.1 aspartyl/asparaginyl beta-hydroxylase domain-containing protein [Polymorphobacter megasporae]